MEVVDYFRQEFGISIPIEVLCDQGGDNPFDMCYDVGFSFTTLSHSELIIPKKTLRIKNYFYLLVYTIWLIMQQQKIINALS